jgi:hypothetical protein
MRGQDLHKAIVVFRTALELAENIRDHFLKQGLHSFAPNNRFYVCPHRRVRGRAPSTGIYIREIPLSLKHNGD